MAIAQRLAWIGAGALVAACGLFPSLDDLTTATGDDASADVLVGPSKDATADAPGLDGGACVSAHGPAMVLVPPGFCIDSTEVTNAQYAEFVAAVSMGAAVQAPSSGVCAWNASVAPKITNNGCASDTTSAQTHPNRPVTCVNWCDAWAYCAWAGKRLCGAIDGGVLDFSTVIATNNQSYVACSAGGLHAYPYGNSYVMGACNTKDLYPDGGPVWSVADTKTFDACVGGYPGIYDLTGNTEEWTDSCQTSDSGVANDECHEFGDCFDYSNTAPARCDNHDNDRRSAAAIEIGFRCCSP